MLKKKYAPPSSVGDKKAKIIEKSHTNFVTALKTRLTNTEPSPVLVGIQYVKSLDKTLKIIKTPISAPNSSNILVTPDPSTPPKDKKTKLIERVNVPMADIIIMQTNAWNLAVAVNEAK